MRAFIEANFKMIDVDSDGLIGVQEFRYNCIQRLATDDIKVVDDAFNQLLNVSFEKSLFLIPFLCLLFAVAVCMTINLLSNNWKSFTRRRLLSTEKAENLILKF